MTNDNDMIRRGDAADVAAKFIDDRLYKPNFPACSYHSREISDAIAALPAVTLAVAVKPLVERIGALGDDLTYLPDIARFNLHSKAYDIARELDAIALTPTPVDGSAGADTGGNYGDLPDYDAGLLNDFGGGDVSWWHDYLRAEIVRANDYWRDAVSTPHVSETPKTEHDAGDVLSVVTLADALAVPEVRALVEAANASRLVLAEHEPHPLPVLMRLMTALRQIGGAA